MIAYNELRESEELLNLRPLVPTEKVNDENELEDFQNNVLRPILKYQSDLLMDLFLAQPNAEDLLRLKDQKGALAPKLKTFLNQSGIKYTFLGVVIALLRQEELDFYTTHSGEMNKRIFQMTNQRISDNL